jgi:hypothetical protein
MGSYIWVQGEEKSGLMDGPARGGAALIKGLRWVSRAPMVARLGSGRALKFSPHFLHGDFSL